MSSGNAANTETVVLAESSRPLQQSQPQAESPPPEASHDFAESSSTDGRSSDAEKMLQSAGVLLDAEGDGVGPEIIDASEQGSAETLGPGEDTQPWIEDDAHELKRVKVYELIGSRWVDQGTAFCFGDFHENEAFLIARAEHDFNQVILTTTIRTNDVYQRQQGA